MESTFKKSIVSGLFWSFMGKSGYLIIGLITNVVLTRLLSPFDFGRVGIVMFFIIISKVLTESGLGGALIRKTETTEEDYSTVFIFNLVISIVLMLLLIIFSEQIAIFYKDPQLKYILIASSSVLLINAFQITQNVKLIRDLKFKKKARYEIISIFIASTLGITLAVYGAGVWAIVVMQVTTALTLTLLLWVFEGTLKKITFSRSSFRSLYKFGFNTTLASVINSAFENIYQLILGRYFEISQAGFFYQGKKLQEIPIGLIKSTTLGVVFTSLSQVQNDPKEFNYLYSRIIRVLTVIVGLICLLVYFYAENIILLLYGVKWIESIFYMKILIIASFFYMQEMFNRIIFKVYDKTEKILYLEVIKKIIQSITVVIGVVYMDIKIILYGYLITSVISFLINYFVSSKITNNYSYSELLMIFKVIGISIGTVMVGELFSLLLNLESFELFILIPFMVIIFMISIHIFRVLDVKKEVSTLLRLVKSKKGVDIIE